MLLEFEKLEYWQVVASDTTNSLVQPFFFENIPLSVFQRTAKMSRAFSPIIYINRYILTSLVTMHSIFL